MQAFYRKHTHTSTQKYMCPLFNIYVLEMGKTIPYANSTKLSQLLRTELFQWNNSQFSKLDVQGKES